MILVCDSYIFLFVITKMYSSSTLLIPLYDLEFIFGVIVSVDHDVN